MRQLTLTLIFLLTTAVQVSSQRTRVNPEILKPGGNTTYFGTNGSGANGSYTIAETDIADGSVFPRLSATETVNGLWTLVNPILKDAGTYFSDDGDATKLMRFQLSGIATGTTRNLTVPNADGTLALTSDLITSLTGDVTGSGTGAVTTTIASNAVTNGKFRPSAALSVVGNPTNGSASVTDIAAGSDHQVLRRSGTSIGFGALNLASTNAVTGALPFGNGGIGLTSVGSAGQMLRSTGSAWELFTPPSKIYTTTIAVPTSVNATTEIGVLNHSSGGRGALAQIDIVLAASGNVFTERYLVPLEFNSTGGAWKRLLPITSIGAVGGNEFDLEMRTNTSGSPSGGIDTLRMVRIAGSTSGTATVFIQYIAGQSTDIFTATSNTSTSSTTDNYSRTPINVAPDKFAVNVLNPTRTFEAVSKTSSSTPVMRIGNTGGDYEAFVLTANPEASVTANPGDLGISTGGVAYLKETGTGNTGWQRVVTESFTSRNYSFSRTMPTTLNNTVKLGHINWSNQGSGGYMEIVIQPQGGDNAMSRKYVISRSFNQTSSAWQIVPSIVSMGQYSTTIDFQLEIKSVNHVDSLRVRRLVGTSASTALVYLQLKAFHSSTVFVEESTADNPTTISAWYNAGTLHQSGSAFSLGGNSVSNYRFASYGAMTAQDGIVRSRGTGAETSLTSASLFLENYTASTGNKYTLTSTNAGDFRVYLNTLLTTQIKASTVDFRHIGAGSFGAAAVNIEGGGLTFADSTASSAIVAAQNKRANSASHAVLWADAAASGGDAKLKLKTGSNIWTFGADASDGNALKISNTDDPGSSPVAVILATSFQLNTQMFSAKFALTDGATIAVNWNNGNEQSVTLGGNRTFTFANPKSGAAYRLYLKQDGTGSRTVTWPTVKWQGGSAPTLTTAANKTDIITIIYDGTDYLGSAQLNY